MRAAAAILLLAIASLTVSCLVWVRAAGNVPGLADDVGVGAALATFERTHRPDAQIDLATLYAGRLDLLDPRLALPTWHKHARSEAARVYSATKLCPPTKIDPSQDDRSLVKAWSWHDRTCGGVAIPADEQIDAPPFMHPSGKSYAALALGNGNARGASVSWIKAHARSFHVLELAGVDPAALEPPERALASVSVQTWEALARGDDLVLTPASLLVADRGPLGLSKLRVYSRSSWDAFARSASLALTTRAPSMPCARPASSALCWVPMSAVERQRPILIVWTASSALLVALASLALGIAWLGVRRRLHRDRIHVLRTLTHELRTPATSLRLDIEPLRAAYDALPAGCQEPLLRISDGIERLHRVLHRSARYMALFETGAPPERLVKVRSVPSTRALFEEFSEEWPEGVSLESPEGDAPTETDLEWLSVAVRNLVENAVRHGEPPVVVTWSHTNDHLVVRVTDGGSTPRFSLRRSVEPYDRNDRSPGLGLGLAIVDRVSRLLGGRLTHEPSPTVFQLRVPIRGSGGTS